MPIFNRRENVIYSGNAAPLERNLDEYLRTHPDCEVYISKRKRMAADRAQRSQSMVSMTPPPAAVSICAKSLFPLPGVLLGTDVESFGFDLGASFDSFETQPKKEEESWAGWDDVMGGGSCCGSWQDVAVGMMDMSVDDLDSMVVNVPPLSCLEALDDCLQEQGPAKVMKLNTCCTPNMPVGDALMQYEMHLDACCSPELEHFTPQTPSLRDEMHSDFVHACVSY